MTPVEGWVLFIAACILAWIAGVAGATQTPSK
jgi:hypothetical protein